jgi:DNA-binding XRE family transcriptional regulator
VALVRLISTIDAADQLADSHPEPRPPSAAAYGALHMRAAVVAGRGHTGRHRAPALIDAATTHAAADGEIFVDANGGYDMTAWPGYRTWRRSENYNGQPSSLAKPRPARTQPHKYDTESPSCAAKSVDRGRGRRFGRPMAPSWSAQRTGLHMATRRNNLARRRAATGYTQETLAEHLHVDRSTVGRWERGTMTPQSWNQPHLAKALGLSARALADLLDPGADNPRSTDVAAQLGPVMPAALTLHDHRGPTVVARIRAAAQAFQAADRRVGGGVLYPTVSRYLQLEIGPRLLEPGDDLQSSALFAAAASITEIAGWMSHDCGKDSLAQTYFDRAFRLATAADNRALTGNACASMAHLAVELSQAEDALRIAAVGLASARQVAGATHLVARLHAMQARAFALNGDRGRCTDALETAERTLAGSGGEVTVAWIAAFDEASLAGEAALCFLDLAEFNEAERHAREVIRLRSDDRIRSRAFGQLTLANVLLRAGRLDEAAVLGQEVCHVIASLTSARVIRRLQGLGRALASAARNVPEAATFLVALDALSHASDAQEGQPRPWPV